MKVSQKVLYLFLSSKQNDLGRAILTTITYKYINIVNFNKYYITNVCKHLKNPYLSVFMVILR